MGKFLKSAIALSFAALCAVNFAACTKSVGKATLLAQPKKPTSVTYEELQSANQKKIEASAEQFAANFASLAYSNYDKDGNFAVAPVSIYMALSLVAECAVNQTRDEILSAFDISYDTLNSGFSTFYRSFVYERTDDRNKLISTVDLSNSIWLDSRANAKRNCVDGLAEKYFCYSYSADFANDNKNANQAIRNFVKEHTRGLIDRDFNLDNDTFFTLINALYLKDVWNIDGDDLPFADRKYDFKQADGTVKNTKLLQGYYNFGRVYGEEAFKTFYTHTYSGHRINFIVPNDGYSVSDVFTAENIAKLNTIKYLYFDEETNTEYFTRCLFPEFSAEYSEDIIPFLKTMGIERMFDDRCECTALTDEQVKCSQVQHATKLEVNKKGVEGAAVTVIGMAGNAAPNQVVKVYEDFVVDKSFGFVLSDRNGRTLFSGVVKKI